MSDTILVRLDCISSLVFALTARLSRTAGKCPQGALLGTLLAQHEAVYRGHSVPY